MTHATQVRPGVPRPAAALHGTAAYRADIDGLRAVAVLAVVVHHLAPGLVPGGYVGVDVFFVISGFLITKILVQEMAQGRFSFASFYARRARRILPALFTVLAATMGVGYFVLLPSDYLATLRTAGAAVLSVSNILLWRETSGYFGALEARQNPLLHTWSLGVEEQFYLVFPLLLLGWMRLPQRWRTGTLALAGLASLGLASALVHWYVTEVFYLLPFRAWELLAGAALATGVVPSPRTPLARRLLLVMGLGAIVASSFTYSDATVFPGLSAVPPVLGAAAVIHAGSGARAVAPTGLLASRPMVYTGLISYSLYLWHWPVIVFAEFLGIPSSHPVNAVALLALSYGLASLSYHLVERPFRLARPGQGPWLVGAAGTLAAAFLGTTVAGTAFEGFKGRFDPQVVRLDEARRDRSPYQHCFGRPLEASCQLGQQGGQPDTLLWGDSHALSWAPPLEAVLGQAGRSALLVSSASCPPMLEMRNRMNPRCVGTNLAVQELLRNQPQIRTVVLTGFWSNYFRDDGPIQHLAPDGEVGGADGAARALDASVAWLQSQGLRVVLLGPVPVYPRSIPLALALERQTGRTLLDRSRMAQEELHRPFQAAAEPLRARGVRVLEPMQWLCPGTQCQVEADGVALYRDAHHMSPAGAMSVLPQLTAGAVFSPPRPQQPPRESAD